MKSPRTDQLSTLSSTLTKLTRWRIFLILCLLGWALAVHLTFLISVPDPVFSPDSMGYALPALHRIAGHAFEFVPERTPGYPLFLLASLKMFQNFFGVLAVQHTLTLIIGVMAAAYYYRWMRPSVVGASIIFFAVSALPSAAVYGHSILTETLYTFTVMSTLYLYQASLQTRRIRHWLLCGLFLSLAVLTRPVAYAMLLALAMVTLVFLIKHSFRRRLLEGSLACILMVAVVICGSAVSLGHWGTGRLRGLVLFGTTAHCLELESIKDPIVKEILRPYLSNGRERLNEFNWVCHDPKGPVRALAKVYSQNELSHVLKALSYSAIRDNPLRFIKHQTGMLSDFFWHYSAIPDIYLNREYSFFIYRGLMIYGAAEKDSPGLSRYLRYTPQEAETYFARLAPLVQNSLSDPEAYLAEIDREDHYRYENVLLWWTPLRALLNHMRWLPCLAFLSSVLLWRSQQSRRVVITFWTALLLHAALSTFAGQESRYAVPVAPLYWILAVAGIETLTALLQKKWTGRVAKTLESDYLEK